MGLLPELFWAGRTHSLLTFTVLCLSGESDSITDSSNSARLTDVDGWIDLDDGTVWSHLLIAEYGGVLDVDPALGHAGSSLIMRFISDRAGVMFIGCLA